MKIRNGYVSNSSSSSFLILCHGIEDFEKLDKFDGYKTLQRDILSLMNDDEENIKLCKEHIFNAVQSFSYQTVRNIYEEHRSSIYFINNTTDLSNLLYEFNIEDEDCPSIKIMYDLAAKIREYADEKNLNISENDDWKTSNEKRDKLYEYSYTIEPNEETQQKITDEIYNFLTKDKKLFAIQYSDDFDAGSYMEHEFMPFISTNPDRKYQIHCINQH